MSLLCLLVIGSIYVLNSLISRTVIGSQYVLNSVPCRVLDIINIARSYWFSATTHVSIDNSLHFCHFSVLRDVFLNESRKKLFFNYYIITLLAALSLDENFALIVNRE